MCPISTPVAKGADWREIRNEEKLEIRNLIISINICNNRIISSIAMILIRFWGKFLKVAKFIKHNSPNFGKDVHGSSDHSSLSYTWALWGRSLVLGQRGWNHPHQYKTDCIFTHLYVYFLTLLCNSCSHFVPQQLGLPLEITVLFGIRQRSKCGFV